MAPKNNPSGPDVGVMLGPDGRLKAVVDFDYLYELAKKAGEAAPISDTSAFLRDAIKKFAAQHELEDEDAIDIAAAKAAMHDESLPLDVAEKIINGDNPIKVYRKYRGLTQKALAEIVGSKSIYISQIETGHHSPSLKLVGKIAKALDVTIDDLVD
ncbi:MAG: helix-turn-helix transcriptional regulator [Alphaproteobacteria bacterium]|jgi:DNA-binding XRE family transcriptional regulator